MKKRFHIEYIDSDRKEVVNKKTSKAWIREVIVLVATALIAYIALAMIYHFGGEAKLASTLCFSSIALMIVIGGKKLSIETTYISVPLFMLGILLWTM